MRFLPLPLIFKKSTTFFSFHTIPSQLLSFYKKSWETDLYEEDHKGKFSQREQREMNGELLICGLN